MQNYQNFIDELFRLDIDTVQYFVKDGQVLYPDESHPKPENFRAHIPADTPADRRPGYVSTYMSLDRYKPENGYSDTLVELQRRAQKDLLLLEPKQTKRILSDAKSEYEKLSRLTQKAGEYHKAWILNTLDQLPSLFLELRLLPHLTGKRPANDSSHSIFAEQLVNVIAEKQGILSGFIEQVENTLQTAPATKPTPGNGGQKAQQKTALIGWFAMPGKYPVIMNLLVDKGQCQSGTYLWIDESAGAKTAVATLIKHLQRQGFYTGNIRPSNEEIVTIAKQTFGVEMSIETVKKAKAPTSPTHNFSFIGPASTY